MVSTYHGYLVQQPSAFSQWAESDLERKAIESVVLGAAVVNDAAACGHYNSAQCQVVEFTSQQTKYSVYSKEGSFKGRMFLMSSIALHLSR